MIFRDLIVIFLLYELCFLLDYSRIYSKLLLIKCQIVFSKTVDYFSNTPKRAKKCWRYPRLVVAAVARQARQTQSDFTARLQLL